MFKGITANQFREQFKDEASCIEYLIALKWENGFTCRRCGCGQYGKGRKYHYRRCKNCKYDESATSGTLFHKCKLGLQKAFEMAYRITARKKGMSSCELSKEYNCQQKSAWLFKAKLQEAMKSSGKYPLEEKVEVDEFVVGGLEKEKRGRSHGKKRLIVLGIEKVKTKKGKESIGRAYAKTIEASSAEELSEFFDSHIDPQSKITTDGWRGYAPLKKNWKIKQTLSEGGQSFSLLHIHIMNIKSWLRGIHHKCSAHRLQSYLNEYHFRFNRRNFLESIFHKIIERAVLSTPMPYSKIKLCELNA